MGVRRFPDYSIEPLERRLLLSANPVNYGPIGYVPAGAEPVGVAYGDFNGDGIPDIVTANQSDETLSVLLGLGGGLYAPEIILGVGVQPSSVAVGDLNHNGHDDIVSTNLQDGTVSVFFGNGDGTFQPLIGLYTGNEPTGVVLADLTGNGFLDIITSDRGDNTACVILNNGNGTFQNGALYPVGTFPSGVAVADVNNDGHPDIITSNFYDNSVSVLLGNGNGTFQTQKVFAVGHEPTSVAAADFTNNGMIDIVTTDEASNAITVLWGNGAGGFGTAVAWPTGPYPFSISTADLNNDGLPDIIVGDLNNIGVGIINVFLSNGDGSFVSEGFYSASRPWSVTAGNFTGNGLNSIISADPEDDAVSLLSATTVAVTGVTASNGSNPAGVQLNWNPVAGAASYQVFRGTTNDISTATKIAFALTTTSYLDTTAVAGQAYFYWIRYRNPAMVGVFSGTVVGSTPVVAPTNVAVNATLGGNVQISWSPVLGAASYQVFSDTINDVTTATKIAFALTTTSFIDTTEVPGTSYFYWVRARNPGGVGAYSAVALSPLLAPTGVTASNGAFPDHVALAWNPVAGAASYQVFRSTVNDITTSTKIAFSILTTGYDDLTVVPTQVYFYWIRARDPAGVGFFSTSVSGATS